MTSILPFYLRYIAPQVVGSFLPSRNVGFVAQDDASQHQQYRSCHNASLGWAGLGLHESSATILKPTRVYSIRIPFQPTATRHAVHVNRMSRIGISLGSRLNRNLPGSFLLQINITFYL